MTPLIRLFLIALVTVGLYAPSLTAQTYLSSTTLSAAMTNTQSFALLTSTTNVAVGNFLLIDGELMRVVRIPVSGRVELSREGVGAAHLSAATVVIVPAGATVTQDPVGRCTEADYRYLPLINVNTGSVWLCRASGGNTVWMGTNSKVLVYNSLTLTK